LGIADLAFPPAWLPEQEHLWEILSSVELQPEVEDTCIFGSSLLLASAPQNWLMRLYLLGVLISILGKEFGRAGHLANANSSCEQ